MKASSTSAAVPAALHGLSSVSMGRVLLWLVLFVGVLPLTIPLVWMVSTSFKPEFDVFQYPPQLIPQRWRLENYAEIFTTRPFARQYVNSIYLGVLTVLGTLCVSSLSGYALARLRFPGRGLVLPVLLAALLLPNEILIVPQYALFTQLGLIGTQVPIVLEQVFGAPAVICAFVMRQFFLSLPRELEEAGRMDGLNSIGVFRHIALPLSGSALATVSILSFLSSWNLYLEPLVFTSGKPDLLTLPVALNQFTNFVGDPNYSLQMAATALSIIPVGFVFVFAQRHIVEGISRSGLKG